MCRFLQICMVALDYFCSQKARKYWRTLPLRCVRFFGGHRPNFGNHPKSLECFGRRRTKASSVRHHKWVEGIPSINCSTLFLYNHFFPKIWPANVTVAKIIIFNYKLRNLILNYLMYFYLRSCYWWTAWIFVWKFRVSILHFIPKCQQEIYLPGST